MSVSIPAAELVNVVDLKIDSQNPNKMSKEQHERLSASIKKWGFIVPIITNKDLLIADGEQRWTVAKSLGMNQVSVIRLPVEDVDRRLLRQVLNKLRGEHELLLDAEEFDKIIELGRKDDLQYLLNLSDNKLERYLNELHPPEAENYELPEIEKVQTDIKLSDLIQLGKHRLMCGDSISKDDVNKLCEKEVELIFTSPPYLDLRDYGGADTTTNHLIDFIPTWQPHTNYIALNLGIVKRNHEVIEYWQPYIAKAKEAGYKFLSWNVWNRTFPGGICQQVAMFSIAHEWIFFFGKQEKDLNRTVPNQPHHKDTRVIKNVGRHKDGSMATSTSPFYQFKTITTVTSIIHERGRDASLHPARFPIELPTEYIFALTEPNGIVADPFGGSGSTLMACEQTGRTCYMMEIDPRYCEIIAQRWEKYTGQKRVKITKNP